MNIVHRLSKSEQNGWHRSRSLLEAAKNAGRGLRTSFLRERNVRVQVIIYLGGLALAWWLKMTWLEMAVIIVMSAVVISLEIINTAVEKYLDIVEPHYDESVRALKDIFAAAVLVAGVAAVIVWLLLFGPPLLSWWFS